MSQSFWNSVIFENILESRERTICLEMQNTSHRCAAFGRIVVSSPALNRFLGLDSNKSKTTRGSSISSSASGRTAGARAVWATERPTATDAPKGERLIMRPHQHDKLALCAVR